MGILSVDLLITLQILPVFFSNCLFLALYDSVILLKHVVLLLSRSKSTRGQWRRMLTSEGMRCIWKSFLLDAYKQVSCAPGASPQGCRGREAEMLEGTRCLQELRGELSGALSGGRKVMLGCLLSTPVPRSRTWDLGMTGITESQWLCVTSEGAFLRRVRSGLLWLGSRGYSCL